MTRISRLAWLVPMTTLELLAAGAPAAQMQPVSWRSPVYGGRATNGHI